MPWPVGFDFEAPGATFHEVCGGGGYGARQRQDEEGQSKGDAPARDPGGACASAALFRVHAAAVAFRVAQAAWKRIRRE